MGHRKRTGRKPKVRGVKVGVFRYVSHHRVRWYLARGWEAFDLGPYHRRYSVGMFKPAIGSNR